MLKKYFKFKLLSLAVLVLLLFAYTAIESLKFVQTYPCTCNDLHRPSIINASSNLRRPVEGSYRQPIGDLMYINFAARSLIALIIRQSAIASIHIKFKYVWLSEGMVI